jgi:hypothetical protein
MKIMKSNLTELSLVVLRNVVVVTLAVVGLAVGHDPS